MDHNNNNFVLNFLTLPSSSVSLFLSSPTNFPLFPSLSFLPSAFRSSHPSPTVPWVVSFLLSFLPATRSCAELPPSQPAFRFPTRRERILAQSIALDYPSFLPHLPGQRCLSVLA